uniref:Protoporphyrinogen oxidase n=1 Tax=Lygus hesperus TaxID=30085 RepID=A0A0A9YYJ2_LYGHE
MSLVLGGGIGGLASAYYLAQGGQKVTLIEGGKRLGGWIKTIRDPTTGVKFDKGPRTLRVKGEPAANTLRLIEELGLEKKVLPITLQQPSAKNRMIYVNNQLHLLPTSLLSLFKKTQPFSKPLFTAIIKDLISPAKKSKDDNIYDFVERRFGKEMADYLVSAMICGICAGDAKDISVKFLMPQLFDMEQKDRSVMVGMVKDMLDKNKVKPSTPLGALNSLAEKDHWSIFGFEGGMETFPRALSDNIISKGVDIKLDAKISKISLGSHSVKCHVGNDVHEGDRAISCLPANNLAELLEEDHPILSNELSAIPFVNVAVVNLAYKGKRLQKDAFGFLIPPSQNVPILGVIFDSCNFDAGDWTVLTVMMGGAWFNKYFSADVKKEQLLDLAVSKTQEILHIDGQPTAHHVSIMKNCIPQYVVGHYDRINRINSYIKDKNLPLSLVGSSFTGIGVNDVILSARKAAELHLRTK